MQKAKQLLTGTAVLCVGIGAATGCHGPGSHGSCCSARLEPQPMPVASMPAAQPAVMGRPIVMGEAPQAIAGVPGATMLLTPTDAGSYASIPEPPRNISRGMNSHADDYSWIEGTLEYTHSGSGHWKLRYAPLSADDTFGGSVVLDTDIRLERFAEGDRVRIDGELVQARSSVYVSGPLYRIRSIRPLGIGN